MINGYLSDLLGLKLICLNVALRNDFKDYRKGLSARDAFFGFVLDLMFLKF